MQTVLLYGNSLVVSTIGASLQACPDLQVLPLDPALPHAIQRLGQLQSGCLIFDRTTVQPDFLLSLLQQPGLLLIGIDPETHEALVWSGSRATALDANDLVRVIRQL